MDNFACEYCEEFEKGIFNRGGKELSNRIIFESPNFLVFPSLGQIVEGYLLIAPKTHYINIKSLPKELLSELDRVKKLVRDILLENYRVPIFFEHGPVSKIKRGGCCIEHAHIHAVPLKANILHELRFFPCQAINNLSDLAEQPTDKPYFFYEDNQEKKYIFEIDDIVPSQYIRKIIAAKVGKPDKWDWRYYPEMDNMQATIVKLSDKLKSQ